jgi:hypothetical protein
MSTKEAIAKAPVSRPRRTAIGVRNVLTVNGKDPDFHYRIVNDEDDRIQQFLDAGYEVVDANTVRVGEKRVEKTTPEGTKAQLSVGGGQKAFVMRIKKEWYDEDQKAKADAIAETEASMKQSALDGNNYGKIDITRS